MLKAAYKDDWETQMFKCFSRFKKGEMLIEKKLRSGFRFVAWVDKNVHFLSLKKLSGIGSSSVDWILTNDLKIKTVVVSTSQFWTKTRKQALHWKKSSEMIKTLFSRWFMVLQLQPWDEATIKSVEDFNFSSLHKDSEIKCEDNANLIFRW